ncbi:MAG: nitrile hydratase subunit beta [Acidimicrobiia bacterium]|jgi:nitrile hydratase|nr:nitrile hydratase subunit beta [Acidimicrobiia bacterium]
MSTAHDMGGMHGFGPLVAEPEATEPVFRADWERTVFGLHLALMRNGRWNLEGFRKMIESQAPVEYLRNSYYENWLAGVERLLVAHQMVTPEELPGGRPNDEPRVPSPSEQAPVYEKSDAPPRFQATDRVRAINRNPAFHTRQPRYVRGREGSVVRYCGAEALPEAAADGSDVPQHLYCVRFEAADLWGPDAKGRDALYIELWEEYLEPAS